MHNQTNETSKIKFHLKLFHALFENIFLYNKSLYAKLRQAYNIFNLLICVFFRNFYIFKACLHYLKD